jgi:hypothetical protein
MVGRKEMADTCAARMYVDWRRRYNVYQRGVRMASGFSVIFAQEIDR